MASFMQVKVASAPQLANTVRLALRKLQQAEKKNKSDEKGACPTIGASNVEARAIMECSCAAARAEKVKGDTQRYQEAHTQEIEALENIERTCANEMRAILKVREML